MDNSKRGLGKGLGALIPQGGILSGGRTIVNIDIQQVIPNPRQPRTSFPQESLKELASSIKEQGVIEPIIARRREEKYELVVGERRWRAAKLAGLPMIPAIIKDFSDKQTLELSLIENLQREDLNPMDEIEGYEKLSTEFNYTQEEIAQRVGKSRSTVTNLLRLLSLPAKIKQSLRKGEINVGHARALLSLEDPEKQIEFWKEIIKNKLNVRDVETLTGVAAEKPKAKKGGRKRVYTQNAELNALVEKLTLHFGTKVKIFGTQERGRIEIEYYSKEDLERIMELIGQETREAPKILEVIAPLTEVIALVPEQPQEQIPS